MRYKGTWLHYSYIMCARIRKWAPADWSTLYQSTQYVFQALWSWWINFACVEQLYLQLYHVCPKILKIMPVDAYNSQMLTHAHLLCSKLCRHNFTYPVCGTLLWIFSISNNIMLSSEFINSLVNILLILQTHKHS